MGSGFLGGGAFLIVLIYLLGGFVGFTNIVVFMLVTLGFYYFCNALLPRLVIKHLVVVN